LDTFAKEAEGPKSWCFDKLSMRISTDVSFVLILSLSKERTHPHCLAAGL